MTPNLGQQLADAIQRNSGPEWRPTAVGYMTGLLNDIGMKCPEAAKLIKVHIAAQTKEIERV